jgi:hypothetical protein
MRVSSIRDLKICEFYTVRLFVAPSVSYPPAPGPQLQWNPIGASTHATDSRSAAKSFSIPCSLPASMGYLVCVVLDWTFSGTTTTRECVHIHFASIPRAVPAQVCDKSNRRQIRAFGSFCALPVVVKSANPGCQYLFLSPHYTTSPIPSPSP